MADWSPGQAELYFANRDEHNYNASIISLIGATGNGGPDEEGATFDGVRPFIANDITQFNPIYWDRIASYLDAACRHGNTLFLYPIDGWNYNSPEFEKVTTSQAETYGRLVAERLSEFPNIVWMTGGDYFGNADSRLDAVIRGIRQVNANQPFSIQLTHGGFSAQSEFWAPKIDWNFVYTYYPTYANVLAAYRQTLTDRTIPALFGEGNYEGEDNLGGLPTTDETLRRQVIWALTSGSPGEFAGSRDWLFAPGWERRLDTTSVTQIQEIRTYFEHNPWWQLVPDDQDPLVTAGRGTPASQHDPIDVLDSSYVTAARSTDGTFAVVYIPTARTITVDLSKLKKPYAATWIDPSAAGQQSLPALIDEAGNVTTPGTNSAGNEDWLLSVTSTG